MKKINPTTSPRIRVVPSSSLPQGGEIGPVVRMEWEWRRAVVKRDGFGGTLIPISSVSPDRVWNEPGLALGRLPTFGREKFVLIDSLLIYMLRKCKI